MGVGGWLFKRTTATCSPSDGPRARSTLQVRSGQIGFADLDPKLYSTLL